MVHTQYQSVATQWSDARTTTSSLVGQTNALASNVADLNQRILDITGLGVHSAPLSELVLGGRVTAMRRDGKALRMSGTVVNPLGRIPEDAELGGRLEIRDRRRPGRAFDVPATVRRENGRIAWETVFFPSHAIRPIGLVDQTWGLWLRLTAGGTPVPLTTRSIR